MPLRKRRFEALEDRRLLTVGAPLVSSVPAAVSTDNPSPSSTADAAAPSTADNSGTAESDGDSSDNYDESSPTAAIPSAAAQSSTSASDVGSAPSTYAPSTYYRSTTDGQDAYNEYANGSYYSAKISPVLYAPTQPTTVTPVLQAAVPDPANAQVKASPADTFNFNLAAAGAGPSGAGLGAAAPTSPPVVRTPVSDLARGGLESTDALSDPIASGAIGTNAALAAPIALASTAGDWIPLPSYAADEPVSADADKVASVVDNRTPALLIGPMGVNLAALEAGIDAVFDRLERLGEDFTSSPGAVRFSQWLVVATGACAAFEYARARYREGGPWQAPAPWPIPLEPRLRRRWLRFRRNA